MTRFLDEFLSGADARAPIDTDPLPPPAASVSGARDTLLLDPALFAQEGGDLHDHSGDDKIGSCGQSCGGCSLRGTPECDSHGH